MKKPFYLNGIKVRCYGEHVGEHIGNLGKEFITIFGLG
jgi:hypothetical protein